MNRAIQPTFELADVNFEESLMAATARRALIAVTTGAAAVGLMMSAGCGEESYSADSGLCVTAVKGDNIHKLVEAHVPEDKASGMVRSSYARATADLNPPVIQVGAKIHIAKGPAQFWNPQSDLKPCKQ